MKQSWLKEETGALAQISFENAWHETMNVHPKNGRISAATTRKLAAFMCRPFQGTADPMSRLPANVQPIYRGNTLVGADINPIPTASWDQNTDTSTQEETGALARIPDTLQAWVGKRYSLADSGLSPAVPKAGQVFLTTADPSDGMQACLILSAKGGQGADTRIVTAVHWLTGRRAGGQDLLYGATFWKTTEKAGKQQGLFSNAPKGQASLFGTGAIKSPVPSISSWKNASGTCGDPGYVDPTLPHIAQPLTPKLAAKMLHWHPDEQGETGASRKMLQRRVGSYTVHYPAVKKNMVAMIAKYQRNDILSYAAMTQLAPFHPQFWREWELSELLTTLKLKYEIANTSNGPGCTGPKKMTEKQALKSIYDIGEDEDIEDYRQEIKDAYRVVWPGHPVPDISNAYSHLIAAYDVVFKKNTTEGRIEKGSGKKGLYQKLRQQFPKLPANDIKSLAEVMSWKGVETPDEEVIQIINEGRRYFGMKPLILDIGTGAPRKRRKTAHHPAAEVMASAADIQRAIDDATQGLPAGEYEITIH